MDYEAPVTLWCLLNLPLVIISVPNIQLKYDISLVPFFSCRCQVCPYQIVKCFPIVLLFCIMSYNMIHNLQSSINELKAEIAHLIIYIFNNWMI